MKLRKIAVLVSVSAILLTSVLAAAPTLGGTLRESEAVLAEDVLLAKGVYWNSAFSDKLTEHYIEYTPGGSVKPSVVYGSMVSNYGRFESMADVLERKGQHVIAGINGDYFDTANYVPLGLLITDGCLRSAERDYSALGFREDGSAFIGWPGIDMSVTIGGERFPLAVINKIRPEGGYSLFTPDFAPTTKNRTPGRDVILRVTDGELTLNSTLTLTVSKIMESKGDIAIPADSFILSLSEEADEWRQSGLEGLEPGSELTVTVKADPKWDEAVCAVGTFKRILEAGKIMNGLDDIRHPRTAVGIREDGTILLYTIDGRQPGHSVGIGTAKLAERLLELGCVDACLMDGGGSTNMNALYTGSESAAQINKPSGGAQRSVTSFIMLVTETEPDGVPVRLGVYPNDVMMLSGALQRFGVLAADSSAHPAQFGTPVFEFTEELGDFNPDTGEYIAGTKSGDTVLTVRARDAEGRALITVVDEPQGITIHNADSLRLINSLELKWNESITLTARAAKYTLILVSDDTCFTWELVPDGGADQEGRGDEYRTEDKQETPPAVTETPSAPLMPEIQLPPAAPAESSYETPHETVTPQASPSDIPTLQPGDTEVSGAAESVGELIVPTARDEHAVFTAAPRDGSGVIRVSAGGKTVNIPVTVSWPNPFSDVKKTDWFYEPVKYVYENGLFAGTETAKFSPDTEMTRGMFVTVLGRLVKADAIEYEDLFSDVSADDYYAPHVAWAYAAGLVTGFEDGSFRPNESISREQLYVLITRFAAYSGTALPGGAPTSEFTDIDEVSAWAADAVSICREAGLVRGREDNKIAPQSGAIRAEVADVFMRFAELVPPSDFEE